MAIRAFLFDFDGLTIDTELASRAGWELLYREHGHELPAELWATLVGTTHAPWDPMAHLEELVGVPLEREALNERRHAHEIALIEAEELRPGIAEYLAAARQHRLKRAIVSSSNRRWVETHLERLEAGTGWDAICTADGDGSRRSPRRRSTSRRSRCSWSQPQRRLRGLAQRSPGGEEPDLLRRRAERGDARLASTKPAPTWSSTPSPTCPRRIARRFSED